MKKFEYKGTQWHEECFICNVCKEPIKNKSFIPRGDEVVCIPCFENKYAQRCAKCNGVSILKSVHVLREREKKCYELHFSYNQCLYGETQNLLFLLILFSYTFTFLKILSD